MFDYPIPLLRSGLYGDLGLSPEATAEEINEARLEQSSRLKSQKLSVERPLEDVYQRVTGLRDAKGALAKAQAESDPAQLRAAQLKLASLEELASFFEQSGEPVFHPSDLTRSDLSQDFSPDPTLDRPS